MSRRRTALTCVALIVGAALILSPLAARSVSTTDATGELTAAGDRYSATLDFTAALGAALLVIYLLTSTLLAARTRTRRGTRRPPASPAGASHQNAPVVALPAMTRSRGDVAAAAGFRLPRPPGRRRHPARPAASLERPRAVGWRGTPPRDLRRASVRPAPLAAGGPDVTPSGNPI